MKFEDMISRIQNFCGEMGFSGEIAYSLYRKKLSDYLKENKLACVTWEQLNEIEKYCEGFVRSLVIIDFTKPIKAKEDEKVNEMIKRICDKINKLDLENAAIVEENEYEITKGLLYGVLKSPRSKDEKYACFQEYVASLIRERLNEDTDKYVKFIAEKDVKFFQKVLPEYWERLKGEKIYSAEKYNEYIIEKKALESELHDLLEYSKGKKLEGRRAPIFDLNGHVVQLSYKHNDEE